MGAPSEKLVRSIAFRKIATGALIFVVYFAFAKLGLHLATINRSASPIWPATGIAIALLSKYGRSNWFAITLAAFAVNFQTHAPLAAVTSIAIGNTLESFLGAAIFERTARRKGFLGAENLVGMLITVLVATPVSATIGALALSATGAIPRSSVGLTWMTWWIGDSLGAILLAPFFLRLLSGKFQGKFPRPRLIAMLALTGATSAFVFFYPSLPMALLFALFPLLLISVFFLGPLESGMITLAIAVAAIWSTARGTGPFFVGSTNDNLVCIALFLAALALTEQSLRFIKNSRKFRLSAIILILGWILGAILLEGFNRNENAIDQTRFQKLIEGKIAQFNQRKYLYEAALRGGVGLYLAKDPMTPKTWRGYVENLDIDHNCPGIFGIGYILVVHEPEIESFTREMRKEYPGFRTYRLDQSGTKAPNLQSRERYIITAIEPRERNSRAIGLDIASEIHRYEGALRAAKTRAPEVTRPIRLIQDDRSQNGFLLFLPIYRREKFLGWVYSPLTVNDFLGTPHEPDAHEVGFRVFFDDDSPLTNSIFDDLPGSTNTDRQTPERTVQHLWGHDFIFRWYKTPKFQSRHDTTSAWVLFACAGLNVLLCSFIAVLGSLTRKASELAARMTLELARNEQVWRSLTEHAPVGIFQLDPSRKITFANHLCQALTAAGPSLENQDWAESIYSDDRNIFEKEWASLKNRKTDLLKCQIRLCGKPQDSDSETWVALSIGELRNGDEITGYVGTVLDITEIRLQQEKLEHNSRLATLGEMASGIAHEINNPLAILSGRAHLLSRLATSGVAKREEIQQACAKIIDTVGRMAKIVSNLRSLSRSGDRAPFVPVELSKIIASTTDLCAERFRLQQIDFRIEKPQDVRLVCREVQIVQVLLNLLNNACDAILPLNDRWITLDVKVFPGEVLFSVTDSGSEISPSVVEKMMNPFYTTKPIGEGTGLGLSISSGIAEEHGGSLRYDRTSKHTRFNFTVSRNLPT